MVVKYARIMWTEFARLREYRLEFFGEYLRIPIQIGLLYVLWGIIFGLSGQSSLGSLGFNQFVFYIGLAAFVASALPQGMDLSEKISGFISEGNIIMILSKPVYFVPFFFAREAADFVMRGLAAVIIFGSAGALLGWYIPTGILTIVLFITSLILAMVLSYFITLSFALLSFFMYSTWGPRILNKTLAYFFSGELIPLTLFPQWLDSIASFLPYKYVLFVPVFIYVEKYTIIEAVKMLFLQAVFIIVFLMVCLYIYGKGLKNTELQGG